MRKFRIYIEHGYADCPPEEAIIEFQDSATDAEIEKECKETWEELVADLDSGWHEIDT